MSFQPVVPFSGYAGWTFVKRTLASQQSAMSASPVAQKDAAYYRSKISSISSAKELVEDRRLLRISLTAFGLEGDVENKAFIRKILESDLGSSSDLANKLADKRYLALAKTFGFGGDTPRTSATGFADAILSAYEQRSFEIAIGNQDESIRLALNAQRELTAIASGAATSHTKWYTILGNAPLRKVVETAFGLPSGFGQLDLDQQLKTLKTRASSQFGSSDPSVLSDPKQMEKLIRNYMIRAGSSGSTRYSSAQTALSLLQGG